MATFPQMVKQLLNELYQSDKYANKNSNTQFIKLQCEISSMYCCGPETSKWEGRFRVGFGVGDINKYH